MVIGKEPNNEADGEKGDGWDKSKVSILLISAQSHLSYGGFALQTRN